MLSNPKYRLGATSLLVGPAAGSSSVAFAVTPETTLWTATTNASWLHLSVANQSGFGSTNVVFSYDANPGALRNGTLTIGDKTVSVTQAGSTYIASTAVGALITSSMGLNGVAVDSSGNVFTCESFFSTIKKWTAANQSVGVIINSGLSAPSGVAVDSAGNLYIADNVNRAIKKWTASNGSLTPLVTGVFNITDVALDSAGNVYFPLTQESVLNKWTVGQGVTTLIPFSVSGLSHPEGVAVDVAGNVYVGNPVSGQIWKWTAANQSVATVLNTAAGLGYVEGVAVDGSGNLYIADSGNNLVKKWTAATGGVTTLPIPGLNRPRALTVDAAGNVFVADSANSALRELPYVFVDPTGRLEGPAAGSDTLPPVLPTTANLHSPFVPTSDQPWLTINNVNNGAVNFSFTAFAGPGLYRTAHISLLGQSITIAQGSATYSINLNSLLVGPAAGSNGVLLAVSPDVAAWTNRANASWLHLDLPNQNGMGSANVVFTYDANAGVTRTGTVTVAGQTVTVVQPGSTYIPAPMTRLVDSTYLNAAAFLAVDGAGNIYSPDLLDNHVVKWTAANNSVSFVLPGQWAQNTPLGVATDPAGNVYAGSYVPNTVEKLTVANNTVSTAIAATAGLNNPYGLACDSAGNLYIADSHNNVIRKWTPATQTLTNLILGVTGPTAVAVDNAGNVYITAGNSTAIQKWTAANNSLAPLVTGLNRPQGVAVDSVGNVYITDSGIKKWTQATKSLTTLVSTGLNSPGGVTLDAAGNIFITDQNNKAIKAKPNAFVDPTPKMESLTAGSDTLPQIIPPPATLLPPFSASSDQPWLTITGMANGVVSFSFTANSGPSRTAHITLLGQSIPVSQIVIGTAPTLTGSTMLGPGIFRFTFTNNPNASFTVLTATNVASPLTNWTVLGTPTSIGPGEFQFTTPATTNDPNRFYRVRSP